MWTMGLSRLVLVAPHAFPHPEARARAVGAASILEAATIVDTLEAALTGVTLAVGFTARPREFAGNVQPVREAALEAARHCVRGEAALVFGGEMSGLSNAELAQCQSIATIPGAAGQSSLNLASAVQVAAYELFVAAAGGRVWNAPAFEAATVDEIEALFAHAERTLAAMRFLNPQRPRRLMPRLRRLFARTRLEKAEVDILRGVLARIDQLIARASGPRHD